VVVNAGGTLLLGGSDVINNAAGVTMAGGTFNTGGFSETVGVVTLTGNSFLDLGDGASVLRFAASNLATWTSGQLLTILNWSGLDTGGGIDQIFFGSNQSALTSSQLQQIRFDLGDGSFRGAQLLSTGELTVAPVPEPSTWAAGFLTVAALGFTQRKRFFKMRASAPVA
jgi:hypothetical protein